jgi:hypothetical protein
MDLTGLKEQLDRLENRYQEWAEPLDRAIQEKSFRVNRDGYTPEDFYREIDQISEAQREKYDPYQEMYALLDQLSPAYLTATAEEREAIRLAISDKGGVLSALLGYVYRSAEQVRTQADKEWLLRGLAAVSIENCSKDYRDMLIALAEMYVAAEEVGIDPKPAFKAVAALSSRKTPRGGVTSVSKMLANFPTYAVLRERKGRIKEG